MTGFAVFGAGSVGAYVGGRLAAAGERVTLIGREAPMARIRADGLTVSDVGADPVRVPGDALSPTADPAAAAAADTVLVTVKSAATRDAAAALAPHLAPGAAVLSLQNGLHNAELLRAALPGRTVLAAVVPFNVVRTGPAAVHRGSGGAVLVERDAAAGPFTAAAGRAGIAVAERADVPAVQRAKLLMNLNNAINALSGLPLRVELGERAYRRCLARCQREALAALDAEGLAVGSVEGLPPRLMPLLLGLPDALFRRLAAAALRIDARARSSMWEDLERGRPTEIGELQGEIVALAAKHGLAAPACTRLVELVRAAEQGGKRDWSGPELLRGIE